MDLSDVYVGLDLGTSALKAVAVAADGAILAAARADYPTARPEAGASEQSPHDWMTALRVAVADLLKVVDPLRWKGIGLSGMIPTLVVADAGGRVLAPAITWEDARAEAQGDALREAVGADPLYQRTGQWLDGRYLLPMAIRLATLDRLPGEATSLLGAKDWLLGQLTGHYVTDPSTATGTGCYDLAAGTSSDDVLAHADALAGRTLPRPAAVRPSTTTYPLLAEVAADLGLPHGLPVAVGAADSVCAVLGLGVHQPGDVVHLAGTSTVILGVGDELHLDEAHRYLVTPLALEGWGFEMDLLATGSGMAWLGRLLGVAAVAATEPDAADELAPPAPVISTGVLGSPGTASVSRVVSGTSRAAGVAALASGVPPEHPDVPVFLPYVAPGEQGALWDPGLTGEVHGLTMRTRPADLARAFRNGLVVESRRCLAVLADVVPRLGDVHAAGQGVDRSQQHDLADASGRAVHACGDEHAAHSAYGAAAIAATACGATGFTVAHVAGSATVVSDPARATVWTDLALRHDEARARRSAPG